ncbi:hypothetical protein F4777DRAFT_541932 [Nemania sp. FL0916]|nr:hypothetical protein F4777DRAFT_541932 [Nemania sp. FL0916]
MSEHHDKSRFSLKEPERASPRRSYYPPPRDIGRYASKALPSLPGGASSGLISPTSSMLGSEDYHEYLRTPNRLHDGNKANDNHRSTSFAETIDERASAMVQPLKIAIPKGSQPSQDQEVVSPQPQYPDSKLMAIWAKGDDLVSPLTTPGTVSWKTHIVSPMSDSYDIKSASESWLDDASSGDEEPPEYSDQTQRTDHLTDGGFSELPHIRLRQISLSHSDPGSPFGLSSYMGLLSDPGPDVGPPRLDDLSGRRTVQPQMHTQSIHSEDEDSRTEYIDVLLGESTLSFPLPTLGTFSSSSLGTDRRPAPPPLKLEQRPTQDIYATTALMPEIDSASPHESMLKSEETIPKQQRLAGFGMGVLSTPQNSPRPPPGFTEIFSQLDRQGVVSPIPKVKNMISKARQNLGIGSEESRRERKREEFKRQIRRNVE